MEKSFFFKLAFLALHILLVVVGGSAKSKKKSILDYNEADLERIYEEWEENDEDVLEDDEKPYHKRPQRPVDIDELRKKVTSPEDFLRQSKKGQTVMMFVTVGDVDDKPAPKNYTEHYTRLWNRSLNNAHIEAQVFVIEDNRAIFTFQDGSDAWEAKDFLLKQEEVSNILLEGQSYNGKAKRNSPKTDL